MDGMEDVLKNADKIQAFSKLMGGEGGGDIKQEDLLKMIQMIQGLKGLFGTPLKEEQNEKEDGPEVIAPEDSKIKVLNAALPFLDKEYQKDLYIAVKLMEMRSIRSSQVLSIQSDEAKKPGTDRRNAMLKAVKPYLNQNEQRSIDMLMRVMKMREAMNLLSYKEEL